MAITVVETKDVAWSVNGANTETITLDAAPLENDFLIAATKGYTTTGGDFTADTGTWTAAGTGFNRFFYRRAGAAEGTTFDFSSTGALYNCAVTLTVLRGVANTDAVQRLASASSLTTSSGALEDGTFAIASWHTTSAAADCGDTRDFVPPSGWVLAGSACQPSTGTNSRLGMRVGIAYLESLPSPLPNYTAAWEDAPSSPNLYNTLLVLAAEPVVVPEPGEPGGPSVQSPLDRYRSSISADAGSLLATTRAVPFDTSHTIAFSPAGELDQSALYPFHEAPSIQSGTPDVMFYPRARQSIDGPVVYDGVTTLTLMERVFPAQILTTTFDAGIGLTGSAQEIITYVFEQWAAEYAWFTYATVPDLRLRDVTITSDWNTDLALARTLLKDSVIRVLQSSTSPRSMRAMLEDLLSPFPGTQFFMNSAGALVIRPVYGPDADATPHKTLTTSDVVTLSIGEPSVDQIVNRCTVSFQQYLQTEGVSVLEPAYVQVASNSMRDSGSLPGPPVTDYLYTAPADRLNLTTEDAGFGGWRAIPLGEGIILGSADIALEDSSGLLITAEVKTYDSSGTLDESWTSPGDLTVEVFNTIPLDGSTVLAFGVRRGANYGGNSYYGRWNARWNASTDQLEIQWAGGGLEVNTFTVGTLRVGVMGVTINGVSTAWSEGATISSTFGVVADGDFVPGPSDTNALAASVTAYGVVEERLTIRGYGRLNVDQLGRIAEAYVIQNLTPRATREVALGWKGAVAVEFDDRGRLIGFPTDAEGLLTGVRYADDFISGAGAKTITIEETVPGSPGTIDFGTVYLLLETGGTWINEDGSPSTPA